MASPSMDGTTARPYINRCFLRTVTIKDAPMEGKHIKYQRLIEFCKSLPPMPTAVVHPCDRSSLEGAVEAARIGLIAPILVGPRQRIEAAAAEADINLAATKIP